MGKGSTGTPGSILKLTKKQRRDHRARALAIRKQKSERIKQTNAQTKGVDLSAFRGEIKLTKA